MSFTVDFAGASGLTYKYHNLPSIAVGTVQAVGGNYAFVKLLPNGNYLPVYFGVADDLSARLANHDRLAEAVALGATYVMAHTTPAGEQARLDEERDLIQFWNPPLNVQHRTTG